MNEEQKTIKNNQGTQKRTTQIIWKWSIEIKNSLERLNGRSDIVKERISDLEDRPKEIIHG